MSNDPAALWITRTHFDCTGCGGRSVGVSTGTFRVTEECRACPYCGKHVVGKVESEMEQGAGNRTRAGW